MSRQSQHQYPAPLLCQLEQTGDLGISASQISLLRAAATATARRSKPKRPELPYRPVLANKPRQFQGIPDLWVVMVAEFQSRMFSDLPTGPTSRPSPGK